MATHASDETGKSTRSVLGQRLPTFRRGARERQQEVAPYSAISKQPPGYLGPILRSIGREGCVVVMRRVGSLGSTLAADGGQAPAAVVSGKSRHAQFRWACDHRLREAFNVLADSSRRQDPWAAGEPPAGRSNAKAGTLHTS